MLDGYSGLSHYYTLNADDIIPLCDSCSTNDKMILVDIHLTGHMAVHGGTVPVYYCKSCCALNKGRSEALQTAYNALGESMNSFSTHAESMGIETDLYAMTKQGPTLEDEIRRIAGEEDIHNNLDNPVVIQDIIEMKRRLDLIELDPVDALVNRVSQRNGS